MAEGIGFPNEEKIRILGEKENCKYLRILEANTIKQTEMKEKKSKIVSQGQGNYLKSN